MHCKIIESWGDLWAIGQKAGATHWNYARGLVRFRTPNKQPTPLGVKLPLDTRVRIRFYVQKGKEFSEQEGSEVLFQLPPVVEGAIPPGFEHWPVERQRSHLQVALQRLSTSSLSQQNTRTVALLIGALADLDKQLAKEDEPVATTVKASAQPPPARINSLWEFLQHPNAEKSMSALIFAFTQSKELTETITGRLKMLPALKAAGLLPFK